MQLNNNYILRYKSKIRRRSTNVKQTPNLKRHTPGTATIVGRPLLTPNAQVRKS